MSIKLKDTIYDLINNSNFSKQLKTSRTIWGQSFDGTGNVDGDFTQTKLGSYGGSGSFFIYNKATSDVPSRAGAFRWVFDNYSYFSCLDILNIEGDATSAIASFRANGNVGIGTTSPSYKLHVNGSLNATTIYQNGTPINNLLGGNYLPLSGGTLSGNLTIGTTATTGNYEIGVYRNADKAAIGVSSDCAYLSLYDSDGSTGAVYVNGTKLQYRKGSTWYDIWHSDNFTPSNYLPLSGGQIDGALIINRDPSVIFFKRNGTTLGSIGFNGDLNPIIYNAASNTAYKLWHSGNLNPSNYLPLSFTTLQTITGGNLSLPITIKTSSTHNHITFYATGADSEKAAFVGVISDPKISGGSAVFGSDGGRIIIPYSGGMYYQTTYNTTPYKIWHEGNDGSSSGLDADLLDGHHITDIKNIYANEFDDDTFATYMNKYSGSLNVLTCKGGTTIGNVGGTSTVLNIGNGSYRFGRFIFNRSDNSENLFWQTTNVAVSAWGAKRQIAFQDSNVASATKLADNTSFTLWGQTFFTNGKPQNVSGDIYTSNHRLMSTYGGAWLYGGIRSGEALSIEPVNSSGTWLTTGITLLQNGNVGIGTISPAYKLEVNGDIKFGSKLVWIDTTNYYIGARSNNAFDYVNWYGHYFKSAGTDRMCITREGLVGIGTTSPAHALDVNGNIGCGHIYHSDGVTYITMGVSGTTRYVNVGQYNNSTYSTYLNLNASLATRWISAAGSEIVRIDHSNGYVGIGTTSPTSKLNVIGGLVGLLVCLQIIMLVLQLDTVMDMGFL